MKYNLDFTLRLARLQVADDIRQHTERIRTAMRAVRVSVIETSKPAEVIVRVIRRDPLTTGISETAFLQMLSKPHGLDNLPWAVDEMGAPVSMNWGQMPHALVGGTAGSGKSGSVNAMLAAVITAQPSPSLAFIDPKRVESAAWGAAALIETDPECLASAALKVREVMMARYKWMEHHGVRNLMADEAALTALGGGLVLSVDELAEFLALAGKEGGSAIASIAQLGRAAAVMLIIATQNPRAELFSKTTGTETLRSNLSWLVAARVVRPDDSDIILGRGSASDGQDASKLPSHLPGTAWVGGKPEMVRAAWLSEDGIRSLAAQHPATHTLDELIDLAAIASEEVEA